MKHHLLNGAVAVTALLAGCQPAPSATPPAVAPRAATASVTVRFETGRALQAYKPHTRADIDHVTLRVMRKQADGQEVLDKAVDVPAASLGDDLQLDALARSTKYVLRADAYDAAGDRISATGGAALPFETVDAATYQLIRLQLRLAPYVPTFGHADGGWVTGLSDVRALALDPYSLYFLDADGNVGRLDKGDTDAGNAYLLEVGPFDDLCLGYGLFAASPTQGVCQVSYDDEMAWPLVPDLAAVAVASSPDGKLYALDADGALYTIASDPDAPWDGGTATKVAGVTFDDPGPGMAFSPAGDLYVVGRAGDTIQRMTPAGQVDSVPTTASGMVDLVVGADGDLLVSSSRDAIYRVAPDGSTSVLAGQPDAPGSLAGFGAAARFSGVAALALAADGTLVASDNGTGALRRIF